MTCSPERDSGASVKHQYVGDVSDYRKYGLVRALSWGGANRVAVCWMLTPSDGSSDGGKLAYGLRGIGLAIRNYSTSWHVPQTSRIVDGFKALRTATPF